MRPLRAEARHLAVSGLPYLAVHAHPECPACGRERASYRNLEQEGVMARRPEALAAAELLHVVRGLREMMFSGVGDGGNDVWDPGHKDVSGANLVAWVDYEMSRLHLVPEAPEPRLSRPSRPSLPRDGETSTPAAAIAARLVSNGS